MAIPMEEFWYETFSVNLSHLTHPNHSFHKN